MLFNSFKFAIFLLAVFLLYWFVFNRNLKWQNIFLLIVSYVFYGLWDWRFLFLIGLSSLVDFIIAIQIQKAQTTVRKKVFLWISLCTNLGILGVFKYFNFFSTSLEAALQDLGINIDTLTLNLVLPVGLSFYTFKTLSYTIDVYKGKLEPIRDIIIYFNYVAFFPQIMAGPIDRAINLLPQFKVKRNFTYQQGADGIRLILLGVFKKAVIADNLAKFVNDVFANYQTASGLELILGAIFFAFQIYGDFSGYSDIAVGIGKLFGFDLMTNFRTPYFSRDIAEFWRRWHISLTTWFREYLYIPLGGSREGMKKTVRNVMIVFIVSGFWHGANWTFIVWGFLNGLYFIPLLLRNKNRRYLDAVAKGRPLPSIKELAQMGLTFTLTCLAWVFFRADNINQAWDYLTGILSHRFMPENFMMFRHHLFFIVLIQVILDWFNREDESVTVFGKIKSAPLRYAVYYGMVLMIVSFGVFNKNEFIYLQF